jgi:hypothetical protein
VLPPLACAQRGLCLLQERKSATMQRRHPAHDDKYTVGAKPMLLLV